ncbi:Uncharacterised protein g6758 [Pycnogonum litorale]
MRGNFLSVLIAVVVFTEEATSVADVCRLPADGGRCRARIDLYYYDVSGGECKTFIYGGCEGNANSFNTLNECQIKCDICKLPKDGGHCRASNDRYYYDVSEGECKKFIYGGCGGNANRFRKMRTCQKKCTNVCHLPADGGPCNKTPKLKYFYNSSSDRCEEFIYRGCGGNVNRFSTLKKCQRRCNKYQVTHI